MKMIELKKVFLVDAGGSAIAELVISEEEEGWFLGRLVWESFPVEVKKALGWYDQVVRGQMLSYLDEATADVQRYTLEVKFPDASVHRTYSLHVTPWDEVLFRISPVPPSDEGSN